MSERVYQRWDRSQIRQHQLLILSFTTLVVTGMPLRFASTRAAQLVISAVGGATLAGQIHRAAAVVMIGCCLWHVIYLLGRMRGRKLRFDMMPGWRDVSDCLHLLLYFLGRRPDRPRYGRYSFVEKFEYWAVIWGSVVMALSGLALWYPVATAKLLPGVWLEVAKVVHGYEALLAGLSILIWHMYHAHLSAEFFPMNRVWLTGTMTEHEMEEHHPLELERIRAEEARVSASAGTDQRHDGEAEPLAQPPDASGRADASGHGLRPPAGTDDARPGPG